jgi:hypothetical protein
MDECGQVVFLETGFAANEDWSMLPIACGVNNRLPQAFGIAAAAHDAALGPTHGKGCKPLQVANGIRH